MALGEGYPYSTVTDVTVGASDLYPGVAVDVPPEVLGVKESRGARFWMITRSLKAVVFIWPNCRTSPPFVKLLPLWMVSISEQPDEPPRMPDWAQVAI